MSKGDKEEQITPQQSLEQFLMSKSKDVAELKKVKQKLFETTVKKPINFPKEVIEAIYPGIEEEELKQKIETVQNIIPKLLEEPKPDETLIQSIPGLKEDLEESSPELIAVLLGTDFSKTPDKELDNLLTNLSGKDAKVIKEFTDEIGKELNAYVKSKSGYIKSGELAAKEFIEHLKEKSETFKSISLTSEQEDYLTARIEPMLNSIKTSKKWKPSSANSKRLKVLGIGIITLIAIVAIVASPAIGGALVGIATIAATMIAWKKYKTANQNTGQNKIEKTNEEKKQALTKVLAASLIISNKAKNIKKQKVKEKKPESKEQQIKF